MSENIIIQEGGVGKNLNAIKKIQTAEQGGGSVYWIPEEEIELGTKTITKNGLYKASKSGVDGWSQVLVNVPGGESKTDNDGDLTDEDGNKARVDSNGNPTSDSSGSPVKPRPSDNGGNGTGVTGTNGVSGVNPNDGNEYYVTRDPNTGELIYTKIPSSIRITKNPDKTVYADGETINPSGIIVHAYYKDGTDHGTVLNSELTFEPMTVDQSISYGSIDGYTVNADGKTDTVMSFYTMDITKTVGNLTARKPTNESSFYVYYNNALIHSSRYNESSVYEPRQLYWLVDGSGVKLACHYPEASGLPDTEFTGALDTEALGMDVQLDGSHITVKWARPTDGKVLTDTFSITVAPNSGQDSGNSGENSGESSDSGGGGSHGF